MDLFRDSCNLATLFHTLRALPLWRCSAGSAPGEGRSGSGQALRLLFFPGHFSWQLSTQSGKQKLFLSWFNLWLKTERSWEWEWERERGKERGTERQREREMRERKNTERYWSVFQDKDWELLNQLYTLPCSSSSSPSLVTPWRAICIPQVCVIGDAGLCSAQPELYLLQSCLLHRVIHPEPLVSKFSLAPYVLKWWKMLLWRQKEVPEPLQMHICPLFPASHTGAWTVLAERELSCCPWKKEGLFCSESSNKNSQGKYSGTQRSSPSMRPLVTPQLGSL